MKLDFLKHAQRLFLPKALLFLMGFLLITDSYAQSYIYKTDNATAANVNYYDMQQDILVLNSDQSKWTPSGIRFQTVSGTPNHKSFSIYNNYDNLNFTYSTSSSRTNAGVNFMTLTNTGLLGIGTTNPDGHLHVNGAKAANQVKIHLSNTAADGYSVIRFSDTSTGSGQAYLHRFNAGWASSSTMWEANSVGFYESVGAMNVGGKTNFKVFTGSLNDERLRIDQNGNVGVGITNPESKFHVKSSGTIGGSYNQDKAYLNLDNGSYQLIMDPNEIYATRDLSIGSSYDHDILFKNVGPTGTDAQNLMVIKKDGKVGIGNTSPTALLHVSGDVKTGDLVSEDISANKITLNIGSFPDYVFKTDYNLLSLDQVEAFINKNGRLPKMPSENEVLKSGMDVGKINVLLVEKIEELTLHMISLKKELDELKAIQK